jgi:hypothetical protein
LKSNTKNQWFPKSNTQNPSFSDSKNSKNQNRRLIRKSNTHPTLERTEGQCYLVLGFAKETYWFQFLLTLII